MRGRTLLFLSVLILVFLGWMFPEWLPNWGLASIPYYTETATIVHGILRNLLVWFDSFLTGSYGVWLLEHIWMIAGGYALVALLLLVKPEYRDGGWENLKILCVATLVLIVWFFGGAWVSIACENINRAHGGSYAFQRGGGSWFIALITGILKPLINIALFLTFWIAIPLYLLFVLFLLPGALYALFRFAVTLPVLLWHHLHYLFVPHPAETAYKAGMTRQVPIPELATTVANAMYQYELKDFDRLPKAWKSKNWEKRIDAFRGRLETEDKFMDELIKNLRLKAQFRE